MSVLVLHTPPAAEPLSPEDVAKSLGLFEADERLAGFIRAARQSLEGPQGWLGRVLVTQTWELFLDAFPCDEIRLPFPPCQRVLEIGITDAAGRETLLSGASYRVLRGEVGRILPIGAWPVIGASAQGVRIRFVAGYGTPADLQERAAPITQALTLMVGRLLAASRADMAMRSRAVDGVGTISWMHPEEVRRGITATEDALLWPFRVWS